MTTIADRVKAVRERIAEAAAKSGRRPEEIVLVAAAKQQPAERVREAILAGVDAVGENRVQEMLEKRAAGAYEGRPLHFIGRLQSNKVRHVVGACDLIESVDSIGLAERIAARARALGIRQDILVEVNIGREASKSGVLSERLPELLEAVSAFPEVRVLGLMAIPPAASDFAGPFYRYFDEMYKLFVDIKAKKYDNVSMRFLSMGMSDSFAEAIAAGSNMVRIGTAIFGERQA